MSKTTKPESPSLVRNITETPAGVIDLALDVVERGQSTAIAVLQDARTELRTAVDHGLELAEKLAAGAFRFARKVVQRTDDTTSDALKGAEKALSGFVARAREAAEAKAEQAEPARSQAA
jgi:hypothetical protein